jgi:Rieske [2Fe-2S] domain
MDVKNHQPVERNMDIELATDLSELDLARTGPGTPGGRFMRRFWMAVCRSQDLPKGGTKPIRIRSVDYALYRGESGKAQVIDYRCPHRGAQMHLGGVEATTSAAFTMAGNMIARASASSSPRRRPALPPKSKWAAIRRANTWA